MINQFKAIIVSLIFLFLIGCQTQKQPNQNYQREWMMVEFQNFSKEFLMKNKAEINLSQQNNGNYSAYMGCNRMFFSADFKKDETVTFSNMGITEMYCNDNQNLEYEFTKWFSKMTQYKIEGHYLTLSDKQGNEMKFVAADWD